MQKLLERYNKCNAAGGDYFEGDYSSMCVLSIKVPIRKKSGNLSYAPRTSAPPNILKLLINMVLTLSEQEQREREREREREYSECNNRQTVYNETCLISAIEFINKYLNFSDGDFNYIKHFKWSCLSLWTMRKIPKNFKKSFLFTYRTILTGFAFISRISVTLAYTTYTLAITVADFLNPENKNMKLLLHINDESKELWLYKPLSFQTALNNLNYSL